MLKLPPLVRQFSLQCSQSSSLAFTLGIGESAAHAACFIAPVGVYDGVFSQ